LCIFYPKGLAPLSERIENNGVHLILSFIYFNLPKSLQRRDFYILQIPPKEEFLHTTSPSKGGIFTYYKSLLWRDLGRLKLILIPIFLLRRHFEMHPNNGASPFGFKKNIHFCRNSQRALISMFFPIFRR
jgi:hypothetical protein